MKLCGFDHFSVVVLQKQRMGIETLRSVKSYADEVNPRISCLPPG
jgi:hypothetical protein